MAYSLADYASMIADPVRVKGYLAALREVLRPGMTVLDLGAGTGFFSLQALAMGASHVYAVEPNVHADVILELARANGFADRVTVFNRPIEEIELPQRIDLIVSDLRGRLPLHGRHIPAIRTARDRYLKPGGRQIPMADTLWVAIVETPEVYVSVVEPWSRYEGSLNWAPLRERLCNVWAWQPLGSERFLTEPQQWARLDYATVTSPNLKGAVGGAIRSAGIGHGVLVWFEAELTDSVRFTGLDGERTMVYGRGFFPWPHPVALEADDGVEVLLRASLIGDSYMWAWSTEIRRAGLVLNTFNQGSFLSEPLSRSRLEGLRPSAIPRLTPRGRLAAKALARLAAGDRLPDIAKALVLDHHMSDRDALTLVHGLWRDFGESS